ncbi:MAG: N-acetylmuramoyl-L-alanine amidase [Myxococcota bacterium]
MTDTVWSGGIAVQRRVLATLVATLALTLGGGDPQADRFDVVVLDAGHGGEDFGARGVSGRYEKDLVLDVARRLSRRLAARRMRVVMTREVDEFVPLERRTSLANDADADLFVSIHANAARSSEPRGIETFFASLNASDAAAGELAERENRAFASAGASVPAASDPLLAILGDLIATEHLAGSNEFALLAQKRMARLDHMPSRGVKQAPFVVLLGVQMPAALVEVGFLTNPRDETTLGSTESRDRLAAALAEAVLEFGRRYDARRGIEPGRSLVREDP